MKTPIYPLIAAVFTFGISLLIAGEQSKTWPGSDKAVQFVKDTIVIDMFASPHGTGWTEDSHFHDYMNRARGAGITGGEMTLAAGSYNFDQFLNEHYQFRRAMAQTLDKYVFVRSVRDIEHAHITGKTAVIWNSQTATIIDGDLKKIPMLKEMGVASIILSYNDLFRTGSGGLAEFNGNTTGVTTWGLTVVDEMVKYGIMVDLSHMGPLMTKGVMDHTDEKHPGVPYVFTHSLPAGLYKDEPKATKRGCYRNISDEEALRAAKSGGYVSPTFTEWMMDGIWPNDISPQQCADMIDYYVKLVGVDHVGIATDDMFTYEPTMNFVNANPNLYNDDGYMVNAFKQGADGCAELAKILAAVTDELWKRGYTDEDIRKIYGGNKMRVFRQVWEGVAPDEEMIDLETRRTFINDLKDAYQSR